MKHQRHLLDLAVEALEEAVDRKRRIILGERRAPGGTRRGVAVDAAEIASVRGKEVEACPASLVRAQAVNRIGPIRIEKDAGALKRSRKPGECGARPAAR